MIVYKRYKQENNSLLHDYKEVFQTVKIGGIKALID